ncbi:efflux RND transporter periplasmic adaptor subunit [bacterium]|nr:efflux RND transporter periplasmic adaptor subunit [bacterium]MBU1752818.1 efflux RND transporter periplasmic adaptor subunit [bacterium]MBU1864715.1 efflux RND transporter periplasmic adaptor subunit [Candidatus Omnitrophota bacterium]
MIKFSRILGIGFVISASILLILFFSDFKIIKSIFDKGKEAQEHDHESHSLSEGKEEDCHSEENNKCKEAQESNHETHNPPEGKEEDHCSEENIISLQSAGIEKIGIKTEPAGPGTLNLFVNLPGEITLNKDKSTHILPKVPGVVKEVRKSIGDKVKSGDVMAILESKELADLKAAYFSAQEMLYLTEANFKREEELWQKKITAEQEYLDAKQQFQKARIELRSAEQKLHSLGFSEENLPKLSNGHDLSYTRYEVIAPVNGIVIEKHISVGEMAREESNLYLIADLNTVWIDFKVHEKDILHIKTGMNVLISVNNNISDIKARISYFAPIVSEETRTAIARAVINNPRGILRPGLFVTGKFAVKEQAVPIAVPSEAVQKKDGEIIVFIQKQDNEFIARKVEIGLQNNELVEITSGIQEGEKVVVKGNFFLLSELKKEGLEDPCH